MDPIVLWQHKWSADLFIPTYLFLGGLTGGVYIVAAVADLLSLRLRRLEIVSRVAALSAVPILALAGFFLTVHLGKPERGLGFPLFFTNYNSWMTRGGWIVGASAPFVVLYAALWYFRVFPGLRRTLAVIGIPLLAFFSMYTGLLLSGAWYVPVWSSKYLPTLFLTSGLTTGVATVGLIFLLLWPFLGQAVEDSRRVVRFLGVVVAVLIVVELYEVRSFMSYLARGAPDKAVTETTPTGKFQAAMGSRLAYEYVTGGDGYSWKLFKKPVAEAVETVKPRKTLAPWFWYGIIGIGLALPLLLTLFEIVPKLLPRFSLQIAALKFALVLIGGYLLRVVIVWGGDLKAPLPYPPSMWPVPGLGGPPIPGLGG
ncbi:MAG: polysulfide reductase NrfD [Deltaproteobacteria bacterium]|nr:polysulfide reductase NrfD [Deltaproteobacteria bacterium]